jgi:hypothetical protein
MFRQFLQSNRAKVLTSSCPYSWCLRWGRSKLEKREPLLGENIYREVSEQQAEQLLEMDQSLKRLGPGRCGKQGTSWTEAPIHINSDRAGDSGFQS